MLSLASSYCRSTGPKCDLLSFQVTLWLLKASMLSVGLHGSMMSRKVGRDPPKWLTVAL